MRTRCMFFSALILILIHASAVHGQIVYNQPASSSLRYYYSNWSVDNAPGIETALSQSTVSISGFVPLRDDFEARYYFVSGYNNLDLDNTVSEMSGAGDLRLQVSHSYYEDRLLFSLGMNLPTGKKELDTTGERQIIEVLSRDYLSFPLRRYGEGFGFNVQVGGAREIGRFKCGLSAVYDYTGTYKPYRDSDDYNPGNALSLNATTQVVSGRINYTGDIGFSIFGADNLDDKKIYKQAPSFNTRLTATYPKEPYSATVGLRMIIRGRNTRYSLTDGIIESQLKKYGDEFDAFLRVVYTARDVWNLGALIGTRQILSSEEELGKSSIYNFGFDINRDFSNRLRLDAGVMYHTGSTNEGTVDIMGLLISCGLSVTY
jgi:hypothetical protein